MNVNQDNGLEKIAIIGMAGRFPGAVTIDQFWHNLKTGRNCVTHFSDAELLQRGVTEKTLTDPNYVKAGFVLDHIDHFDANFFGYTARDAELMDPQQRVFLELAWEALENAGCNPGTYAGAIGVFGGTGASDYLKRIPAGRESVTSGMDAFQAMLGNDADFLATRISYKLNLKGPSLTLQTACSTSLVAVHVACQNLLTYQCDMALAGGVSIRLPQGVGYTYHEGMLWSPDGCCRAFDAKAQGTVFGRGAGLVALKRLSEAIQDGDHIYAVIRGSAINNDGALKVGFTAPSVDGQAQVIATAQALSDTPPDTIGYIEAHGTGTRLGDPIEIEALTQAFRAGTRKTGYCGIGSVKTNIGHLDVAAGIASLIKTTLALHRKEIPPSLHFETPNPDIDFDNSPFYVVNRLQAWQSDSAPRRAGVSSFGVGGTNAHVILEEAPPPAPTQPPAPSSHILTLSAKTRQALMDSAAALATDLGSHPDRPLADVAYTLHTGRSAFPYRMAVVCQDVPQAIDRLMQESATLPDKPTIEPGKKKLAFMFSGQGAQYVNMGQGLYRDEPLFRQHIDQCAEILRDHLGLDLREVLFPEGADNAAPGRIDQTWITQPALFVIEYSLARLLMQWGLTPHAMVGHSIGEYVAACLAGVLTLQDALALVAARGRLFQDVPPGAMLSIPLSEADTRAVLPAELDIAAINAPNMTVVSGPPEAIAAFNTRLADHHGITAITLRTSHAFHSRMVEPIQEAFARQVAAIERRKPEMHFISNLTGTWITDQQATSPDYWAQHLRQPVRFHDGVTTLLSNGHHNLLEVGPNQALTILSSRHPDTADCLILPTTRKPQAAHDDRAFLLNTLGKLWTAGTAPDWHQLHQGREGRKIPLPTYPFQRKRFWYEATEQSAQAADSPHHGPDPAILKVRPKPSTKTEQPGASNIAIRDDIKCRLRNIFADLWGGPLVDISDSATFLEMGFDSLSLAQAANAVQKQFNVRVTVEKLIDAQSTLERLTDYIRSEAGEPATRLTQQHPAPQSDKPEHPEHPDQLGTDEDKRTLADIREAIERLSEQVRGIVSQLSLAGDNGHPRSGDVEYRETETRHANGRLLKSGKGTSSTFDLQILDGDHPPVEGARIGRDPQGNPGWYIEDRQRKGKYLLIKDIRQ